MSNIKTKVDEWEVKDLEDNSTINVYVEHNTEMGNKGLPGVQVRCFGQIVNYEPIQAERWAYEARKTQQAQYLLEGPSWLAHNDTFIKHFFVPGATPKARVEVKVRSKTKSIIKEYELPFTTEEE